MGLQLSGINSATHTPSTSASSFAMQTEVLRLSPVAGQSSLLLQRLTLSSVLRARLQAMPEARPNRGTIEIVRRHKRGEMAMRKNPLVEMRAAGFAASTRGASLRSDLMERKVPESRSAMGFAGCAVPAEIAER